MKQEDKELVLRYLSMALPYGVVIKITLDGGMLEASYNMKWDADLLADLLHDEDDFKPYLRPMSSMTEEELEELNCLCYHNISVQDDVLCGYICGIEITDVQDFLLRYHFDFMDLIPKGLAIKVAEENNPYSITEE